MLVQEAGNPLLEFELAGGIAHRCRIREKIPLDVGWKIVPLHDHSRAEAFQDVLFVLAQRRVRRRRRACGAALIVPAAKGFGQVVEIPRHGFGFNHPVILA